MGKHRKTLEILAAAREVLAASHPMTVRQLYYQLVSRQVIKNSRAQYQAVSTLLVDARKAGDVPWDWIEDRLRMPRAVPMWEGLSDFADTVRAAYRRNIWPTQEDLIEVWLEKDALSGVFEEALRPYRVTLNVGRGYDGWASIRNAAERYQEWGGKVTVLYFGDFDPSGEDMVRSLRERLGFFQTSQEIVKCALTPDDIRRYRLPADFAKATDSRRSRFVSEHGDNCVELDALPVDALRERIRGEVESRLDLAALAQVKQQEEQERQTMHRLLANI